MEHKSISLDRDTIKLFIEDCTNFDNDYSINELIAATMQMIPLIGNYEEEGKKLNFKLAVGINTQIKNLEGRFHILRNCQYDNDELSCIYKIKKMIKEVAIFCEKEADIFLVQNENEFECGVYFTDLEKTGSTEEMLLSHNFVIIQNLYGNKIAIMGKEQKKLFLCFDLDEDENLYKQYDEMLQSDFKATVCRTWKGIFERVKKTVHGTICLIVDEKWDAKSDKNFSDSIQSLNINLSRDDSINADRFQDFENRISLFLSMLNFDGITIIDTDENIRAYNVFCKIKDNGDKIISGGARHRAYTYLKDLPKSERENYVGIYFQSHEGEIKFYQYLTDSTVKEINYFDSKVMNGRSDNRFYKVVKKHLPIEDDVVEEDHVERKKYSSLEALIDDLINAHNGVDNFYREPLPAENLVTFLSDDENAVIIQKYNAIRRKLINIIIECIIGNTYGYSRAAQDNLNIILNIFTEKNWRDYFEKMQFIDNDLLWTLTDAKPYYRWSSEILPKSSHSKSEVDYSKKDFYHMYQALRCVEEEKKEEDS